MRLTLCMTALAFGLAACGDDTPEPTNDTTTSADTSPGTDTTTGTDTTAGTDATVTEPDDSTHAPGFWPPGRYTDLLVRSGSRLSARAAISEEGNASLLHFDDAVTGQPCVVRMTDSGQWRCLPERELHPSALTQSFSDQDCTTEAVALSGETCADGLLFTVRANGRTRTGTHEPVASRVVRLSRASGRAFRRVSGGACEPYTASRELSAWAVSEEPPLEDFVAFEDRPIPIDDTLAVHVLRGADGSRMAHGIWLRDHDAPAAPEEIGNDSRVLRALPMAHPLEYRGHLDEALHPDANFRLLDCDDLTDTGPNKPFAEMALGVLIADGQPVPYFFREGWYYQDWNSGATVDVRNSYRVGGAVSSACEVPTTINPQNGRPVPDYHARAVAEVPEGYTLYRLGPPIAAETFPRIERSADTRAGGVRFAHYETVMRTPLLPVSGPVYRDGQRHTPFWANDALVAIASDSDAAVVVSDSPVRAHLFTDAECLEPLGQGPVGRVYTLSPWPAVDLCAIRGQGIRFFETGEPVERRATVRVASTSGEPLCQAHNNGNPGTYFPLAPLTLPDARVLEVPVETR